MYRITQKAKLLQNRIGRNQSDMKYIKHRKIITSKLNKCNEIDIQIICIPEKEKTPFYYRLLIAY